MSKGAPGRGSGPIRQPSLFDGSTAPVAVATVPHDPDADARAYAVDPRHNVVLEASAGTGKTSVLVARYINLLAAGVDPANILAITFTRKAAAEMRERIVRELRAAAGLSELDKARWLELRDRLNDIAISTIDAFCLSLLREFPLEADVDPGFELADETEVPRLVGTALDRSLRIFVGMARSDADIALVLAQLGINRTREGLASLLERRLVAWDALDRFLARGPRELTSSLVCRTAAVALADTLKTVAGGLPSFLADGPSAHPRYELFRREVGHLGQLTEASDATVRAVLDRISAHFLTLDGKARRAGAIPPYRAEHYPTKDAARRHREALFQLAPQIEQVMFAFNRDLNVVLARGIRRMFAIALRQYRAALEERSVLDFSDVLERALELLRRMDEFSQSRFRLESRYHHVLVDEFQDTSRAQWELVSLLIRAWGEGLGLAANPSIFIVGDRKQSIYRFRDADVSVLHEAAQFIDALRPDGRSRRSIARSFRAVPELLQFVNDVFTEMCAPARSPDEFSYDERDRFPVDLASDERRLREPALGLAAADSPDTHAAAVADEIAGLLANSTVRDKTTGVARPTRPGDIAILFRSRTSHRELERELGARGIPSYVYKGLGFFDADEIKDLFALVRYLADPSSGLRAAAFLRSRFVRLSDAGLAALAPDLSAALLADELPASVDRLDAEDRRVLCHARSHVHDWLRDVDRVTPAELIDRIITNTAYAFELGGVRYRQAWENIKKMRGLIRRIQNRGYATLPRIAEHLLSLTAGDESNAVVEALDAVNLMTVHASKGLEFPIVFVVNLAKGASGPPKPVRVIAGGNLDGAAEPSVTVGPFLSDTDEAERDRERHETRRLLYVALTRARDRLYLASIVKEGTLAAGRGSLAEVLPDSLRTLFARAIASLDGVDTLGWTGVSGHEYAWRLCRPPSRELQAAASSSPAQTTPAGEEDDFAAPLATATTMRVSAIEAAGTPEAAWGIDGAPRSDRLAGLIVHRLFDRGDRLGPSPGREAVIDLTRRLVRPEEWISIDDPDAFVRRMTDAWMQARAREDVADALSGERRHEVPFSVSTQEGDRPQIVRGVIDCLVRFPDGRLSVVELKTGRPHPAHQRQLDVYVRAARALHPEAAVTGLLLYV